MVMRVPQQSPSSSTSSSVFMLSNCSTHISWAFFANAVPTFRVCDSFVRDCRTEFIYNCAAARQPTIDVNASGSLPAVVHTVPLVLVWRGVLQFAAGCSRGGANAGQSSRSERPFRGDYASVE